MKLVDNKVGDRVTLWRPHIPRRGFAPREADDELTVFDSAAQKYVVKKADIASRRTSEVSLMPEGLERALTLPEFADLISFLEGLKNKPPEAKAEPAEAEPAGAEPAGAGTPGSPK